MSPMRKRRCCRRLGGQRGFKPMGIPGAELERSVLNLDEFEAMRLTDLEGLSQIEAAESMQISRGTVQRLLNSGRKKVMEAFLNNKMILIRDGVSSDEGDSDEKDENCFPDE